MKKLIGKEMSLMKLNEIMQEQTGSKIDIFNYSRDDWGNFSWYIEKDGCSEGLNVNFEILNSEEDDVNLIVRILEVSEI